MSHVPHCQGAASTPVPLPRDGHSAGGSQCHGDGSEAVAAGAELQLEVAVEHSPVQGHPGCDSPSLSGSSAKATLPLGTR